MFHVRQLVFRLIYVRRDMHTNLDQQQTPPFALWINPLAFRQKYLQVDSYFFIMHLCILVGL